MRRRRRELQETSLSFLDVISCGFGAVVLLLVIGKVGDPSVLEEAERQVLGTVKEFQERLLRSGARQWYLPSNSSPVNSSCLICESA